ncbi:MAG: hypothetical protein CMH46_00545 [Muricauda sp.]|nr:hypothetical protein [Allomuricauda sp.]MAU14012.1 hypothetical protein [Allomuricauda sp.]
MSGHGPNSEAYKKRRAKEAAEFREATQKRLARITANEKRIRQSINCSKIVETMDRETCDKKGFAYGCYVYKDLSDEQLNELETYIKEQSVSEKCMKARLRKFAEIKRAIQSKRLTNEEFEAAAKRGRRRRRKKKKKKKKKRRKKDDDAGEGDTSFFDMFRGDVESSSDDEIDEEDTELYDGLKF